MDAKEGVEMASSLLDTGWSIGKDVAKALPTHRECKVHITNECSKYTLCNPSVHTESGRCFIPFPPTIRPPATGDAKFAEVPNTASASSLSTSSTITQKI
ncbi:hypothetical protein OYC64_015372 [Pagothenia borchgrevinki]|uniref:Uncharacterized protein n=1 Tax=Pagothenia borchgrevinki TaxID=8213 RepID=A0ABD2HGM7_PAGBO